ncbi:Mor transcription activator family protein [Pseudoduganella sp. RAF53_2]|uniref:Mor transcription activator family protein n=1 Tax=unclassified Pseudoduganella TaxID=2637179 RepID=UPI003F9BF011
METDLSHLPPSAQRLVGIIGLPATLLLVDRHGGKALRLYKTGESIERLTEAVGAIAAGQLLNHFGSDPFTVPKCRDALNDVRNARIHREYDRLTQIEKRSGRDSVHCLVEQFCLSERHVWRVLKQTTRQPKVAVVDSRQLSLL